MGLDDFTRQPSKPFYWTGIRPDGTRTKNEKIMAVSRDQVVTALAREGVVPIKITDGGGLNMNMSIGGAVKFKWNAKAEFARRLYQLLRAGVSIPKSLASIGEDAKPNVAEMCAHMADAVAAGSRLSEALAEYPKAFDEVFVSYVEAGEDSGTLLISLERLSVLLAKRAAMASKIKGVMAYPKMVGGTILLLTLGIIMFLVPRFVDIYASFGAELPGPTLVMVKISKNLLPITTQDTTEAITRIPLPIGNLAINILSISIILALMYAGWVYFRKQTANNDAVNVFINKIMFKMPVFGKLNHKNALFRWASTLSGALTAGVQMGRALEMAASSSGSKWIESITPELVEAVRSGRPIGKVMQDHPDVFPVNIRTMVVTGEDTGELDTMLASVSQTLDEEVDGIIEGLSAKIEVVLLLVLGVVVGGLLLILYLPILQLATTASKGLGGA